MSNSSSSAASGAQIFAHKVRMHRKPLKHSWFVFSLSFSVQTIYQIYRIFQLDDLGFLFGYLKGGFLFLWDSLCGIFPMLINLLLDFIQAGIYSIGQIAKQSWNIDLPRVPIVSIYHHAQVLGMARYGSIVFGRKVSYLFSNGLASSFIASSVIAASVYIGYAIFNKNRTKDKIISGRGLIKGIRLDLLHFDMFSRSLAEKIGLNRWVVGSILVGLFFFDTFLHGYLSFHTFHFLRIVAYFGFSKIFSFFLQSLAVTLVFIAISCLGCALFTKRGALRLGAGKHSLQMPPPWLTQHALLVGSSGSGKSNAIYQWLDQLREKGDKVIIVDTTCSFVTRYYREGTDVLLNPLDARAKPWHLWTDAKTDEEYVSIAASLIPEARNQTSAGKFFDENSRTILEAALGKMAEEACFSLSKLLDLLLNQPICELRKFLHGTVAFEKLSPDEKGTAQNIRTTLATYLKPLLSLPDVCETERAFSIREWIGNEADDSWLFLSSTANTKDSLKPLISCQINLIIKEIMRLNPDTDRQIWIIIDELPSLGRIDSLPTALAENRKYGGSIVLGTQSESQLKEIYGPDGTNSLLQNLSHKFFFKFAAQQEAKRSAEQFGEIIVKTATSSSTISANDARDSSSYHESRRKQGVLDASQLLELGVGHCYLLSSGYLGKKNYILKLLLKFPKMKGKKIAVDFIQTAKQSARQKNAQLYKTSMEKSETDDKGEGTSSHSTKEKEMPPKKEPPKQEKRSLETNAYGAQQIAVNGLRLGFDQPSSEKRSWK